MLCKDIFKVYILYTNLSPMVMEIYTIEGGQKEYHKWDQLKKP